MSLRTQAAKCIEACEKAGVSVKHGVDATALQKRFQPDTFHCCIFNFPHTGEQRVHSNQAMLRDFFKSARCLVYFSSFLPASTLLWPHACFATRSRASASKNMHAQALHSLILLGCHDWCMFSDCGAHAHSIAHH